MDIETEPTWIAEIGNLHRHGFNSLVAIVDIILLAYPVKIMHFVYTCAYGWCYAIVIFIYWVQDPKKNIVYKQIDYGKPVQIMVIFTMLTLLTLAMQTFHFFAYQLKFNF
ncbi:rolling stone [Brachionus plicatilis]|uniref:Rolling stone n=1 Tax=Brachionus plicatilis TaxID=10195 RepID=A0A3M7QC79_BRAPC|nr:rolling stone [Brachionus plicatilis]